MCSDLVVLRFQILNDQPAFAEGIEYFTPPAFSPELIVGTFDIPVLPWTARIDIERFDTLFLEPLSILGIHD
tara:strand:- start:3428 stop:3643 length:216 start_codon:yes stop_codon:yes gene_type:complete